MIRDNPRTRPAKAPLSRDAVVAAALRLIGEVGYAAVTMRRVAQELDTGPASLYVYVADRDELMAAAYDLALSSVPLDGEGEGGRSGREGADVGEEGDGGAGGDLDWRFRLEALVERAITVLGGHDQLALVALTRVQTGPHSLRITEEMLRLLRMSGLPDDACVGAADLIDQYVTSSALERAAWRSSSASVGRELDEVYGSLDAGEFPTIAALHASMTSPGDRAAWKLRVIIDGLLAQVG